MKRKSISLSERDIANIVKVLEWAVSDYGDDKHVEELEKLRRRFENAEAKLRQSNNGG